jgi:hypothetical protein
MDVVIHALDPSDRNEVVMTVRTTVAMLVKALERCFPYVLVAGGVIASLIGVAAVAMA